MTYYFLNISIKMQPKLSGDDILEVTLLINSSWWTGRLAMPQGMCCRHISRHRGSQQRFTDAKACYKFSKGGFHGHWCQRPCEGERDRRRIWEDCVSRGPVAECEVVKGRTEVPIANRLEKF